MRNRSYGDLTRDRKQLSFRGIGIQAVRDGGHADSRAYGYRAALDHLEPADSDKLTTGFGSSAMDYDLGYFDLEHNTLRPLDNPFGSRLSPMSWVRGVTYVSGPEARDTLQRESATAFPARHKSAMFSPILRLKSQDAMSGRYIRDGMLIKDNPAGALL